MVRVGVEGDSIERMSIRPFDSGTEVSMPLVLAIDLGTSTIKTAVIDERGTILAEGRAEQKLIGPERGVREHDPRQMWQATRRAISGALNGTTSSKGRIGAVVVTGPRGTFCFVDRDGRPLSNFVTWQDQRGAALSEQLYERFDQGQYRELTGMGYTPFAALSHVLWMQQHRPDLVDAAFAISTPQGHILRRLGANLDVVEPSTAAHIGLLELERRRWSPELRSAFALNRLELPAVVDTGAIVGRTSVEAQRQLGLPSGITLVLAGSDGICQELGLGVINPGQVYAYLGTASAIAGPILASVGQPSSDLSRCGVVRMPGWDRRHDRLLGLGGAGASAADWIATVLGLRHVEMLDGLVEACEPGASGMLFLPTLAGAVAPEPESTAFASFVGLAFHHRPEHFARSVLEGVAIELRWMLEDFRFYDVRPTEVRLTGGGARSAAWRQIVADVLQIPVLSDSNRENGLRGAAIFAYAATTGEPIDDLAVQWSMGLELTEPSSVLGCIYERMASNYRLLRQVFVRGRVDRTLFDTSAWLAMADSR